MIKVEFINGPMSGETRLYRFTPVRIGREIGCDLVIEHDTLISRKHAVLVSDGGQVVLEDLGASNPILVNGHPVLGKALLESGDVLTFGGTELRFRWIEPPRPVQTRKRSVLEWIATGVAGCILLAQVILLGFYAPNWRSNVDVDVLRPTPTPVPVEILPEEPGTVVELEEAVPAEGALAEEALAEELVIDEVPAPEPTPTPLPMPTPTPIPMTESMSAAEQLERAKELIRERRLLEADRLLIQLGEQEPEFLPAIVEYARLMGRQSRFQESIDAWRQVLELAEGGSLEAREASIELPLMERRLRQLQRPIPTPIPERALPQRQPPPSPRPAPIPDPPTGRVAPAPRGEISRNPWLILEDVQTQRFADQSVADMREVRFTLRHVFGAQPVPAGQARVVARFYESDGRRVFPANIPAPEVTVRINRELNRGEVLREVRVIYQVPRGPRPMNSGAYYGVVLRAYVGERLEHEISRPTSLLQLSD